MSFERQYTELSSEDSRTGFVPREDPSDPIEEYDSVSQNTEQQDTNIVNVSLSQYGLLRSRKTREERIMESIEDMIGAITSCGNKAMNASENICKYSNSTMSTADSEDLMTGKYELESSVNELCHLNAVIQELKEDLQELFDSLRASM